MLRKLIRGENAVMALLLVVATFVAYHPAWQGGMLWDDAEHFTKPDLQSWAGLSRIWLNLGATQQYYPLLHSAFWVQQQLWGDQTLGYHLVNIGLHALNALLLWIILRRLQRPGALLAAAIFALHPVHVESVAWMTELKNTLSGFFYLGSALAYLGFDRERRKGLYSLALALFLAALFSKTTTATLPAGLLLVFWWQRGGLSRRRDVLPLLPFFALGIGSGLFTAWVERTLIGAQGAEFDFSAIERCLIAGRAIVFYFGKFLWPANLIFTYPRWNINEAAWWQYLYPLGVFAALGGLWLASRRRRGPLTAMLFFCGTLFPVLGFFNVYPFRFSLVADHFQYLASLGLITLFATGIAHLAASWPRRLAWAAMLTLLSLLGGLTWHQSHQYRDAETLYRSTLLRNPSSWMAHSNLGHELSQSGRYEEAFKHYQEACQIKPDDAQTHVNWGAALMEVARQREAIEHFQAALLILPDYADAANRLGLALKESGRPHEAIAHYEQALRSKPDFADAHNNWGNALQELARPAEAADHYQQVLRLDPDHADAHNNLGLAMHALGRHQEAIRHYQETLRIKPDHAEAHYNWGLASYNSDHFQDAIEHYRKALQLNPDHVEAHNNLGIIYAGMGKLEDAQEHFEQAIRLNPDFKPAQDNLRKARALIQEQGDAGEP
jgi:tetratricopeptide (TPR) repeat protein